MQRGPSREGRAFSYPSASSLALDPAETDARGGTGSLTGDRLDYGIEEISGVGLEGSVTRWSLATELGDPIAGRICAPIPGPSAEPPRGSAASTVSTRLELDGQPVHLEPGHYSLELGLGDQDCLDGWGSCRWFSMAAFDLRPDEDIWIKVMAHDTKPLRDGALDRLEVCPV